MFDIYPQPTNNIDALLQQTSRQIQQLQQTQQQLQQMRSTQMYPTMTAQTMPDQQMQQQNNQVSSSGQMNDRMVFVKDRDSALKYNMGPNERTVLFDKSRDVFYVIETDASCSKTIETRPFGGPIDEDSTDETRFVTVAEMNKMMTDLKEEISHGKQSVYPNKSGSNYKRRKQYKPNGTKHDTESGNGQSDSKCESNDGDVVGNS
jgi:hypothetical protein